MSEHVREPIDFAAIMPDVARLVWGEPTLKGGAEMRWGNSGARVVVLSKGVFQNHSAGTKGGLMDFLEQEVGISGKAEKMAWLAEQGFIGKREQPTSGPQRGKDPVATYDYTDEAGTLLFQVCRFEPGKTLADGTVEKKTFRQRKPDGVGGWSWKVAGTKQVPYRLAELIEDVKAGETIFIAEGEKDVDKLRYLGIPATSNAGGAGKWRDELSPYLKGADVVLLEDNDEAGRGHTAATGRSLIRHAKRVRILPIARVWRACPEKGDVSDWFAAGAKADTLYRAVAERAVEWDAPPFASQFGAIRFRDMDQPWPEHQWLVKKVLARGEVSLMAGPSGSGKTFEALNLGMSVATERPFHTFRVNYPGLVIYQAGESGRGMMKRWRAYRDDRGIPRDENVPFVLLTSPLDLYASEEDTDKLIAECRGLADLYADKSLELIVIDTLAAATAGANENTSEDMGPVLARCGRLARDLGCAVLLVHHMNAEGHKVRGWTGIQANVDGVITIRRDEAQMQDDDQRFIRYGRLTKMKDGEDGLEWRFVLKNVVLGQDQDGDDITTCVVTPPRFEGQQSSEVVQKSVAKQPGIMLNPSEMGLFRALIKATKDTGVPVPEELGAPEGALMVRDRDWKRYAATTSFDGEDFLPEKVKDVDQKIVERLRRFGAKMRELRVIGRDKPHTWITGRPVKGVAFDWFTKQPAFLPAPAPGPEKFVPFEDEQDRSTWLDDDLPI